MLKVTYFLFEEFCFGFQQGKKKKKKGNENKFVCVGCCFDSRLAKSL